MTTLQQEIRLQGVAASPGISIGKIYVFEGDSFVVTKKRLTPNRLAAEVKRFRKAVDATHKDLNQAEVNVLKMLGKQHARLIEAHKLILEDPIIKKDTVSIIENQQVNAEYALSEVLARANLAFEAMTDEFFRERRHDLFDVGRRILGHLTKNRQDMAAAKRSILESSAIVAKNLLPSDTLNLREKKIIGFATELGGRTSHVAILAQSLGIPAVVAVTNLLANVATGEQIVIDGNEGAVVLHPSVATLKSYKEKQHELLHEERHLLTLAQLPAMTADAHPISIQANLDTAEEVDNAKRYGAAGIGLFRTEFVCLGHEKGNLLFDEEAQYNIYKKVLEAAKPDPVVIRLLDIGADKLPTLGAESSVFKETGAATALPLGLRGIRLALRYPRILRTQLRAIARASTSGNAKILLPMVSAIDEVREVKWLIEEINQEIAAETAQRVEAVPMGIMVEVPSVAVKIAAYLPEVDFISVGTNDLVQYTLACDRTSAELAYLYQEFHPSILQLLYDIAKAANAMGKWASVCGELAGNPLALPLLLGMGYQGISVNPHVIPRLKQHLKSISLKESKVLAEKAISFVSYEEVVEFLKREYPVSAF
ncbi:MAG: phosphoenolpyruvate--protein phosphotransferase [Elusimicrobiota bacterium]